MSEGVVLRTAKEIQDREEYKRRLLLDILIERGIFFDLETRKIIDDKTSLETLLRILQIEKEKEKGIKHLKDLNHVDKPLKMETDTYESVYDSWIIAYKIYIMWLSRFMSKLYSCWA